MTRLLRRAAEAPRVDSEDIEGQPFIHDSHAHGFMAATMAVADDSPQQPLRPGINDVRAICEVSGGGQKIIGVAIRYDVEIDPSSLELDSYGLAVYLKAYGKNGAGISSTSSPRTLAHVYTNSEPTFLADHSSVTGVYVSADLTPEYDPSSPTRDSDRVSVTQDKAIRTLEGAFYPASRTLLTNDGLRGANVAIRGVDEWEQNHWWWDDERSTWLEYSIYLPKSFLKAGGEDNFYPLVLAVTHSGTSYGGTCAETLLEQHIASIWSLPEEQERHECVVITPRYERTTMNDYWEHTSDVENTYRLVKSLMSNTWNYGNPNLDDRRDKVLKIDPKRVYATGWSMGAMTSLWLMAKHPETFAAGLIIAGQQRPRDVVNLANQKALIITGTADTKATPWNEKCVEVWRAAGGKVTRPDRFLDPGLIFPIDDQEDLTKEVDGYIEQGGNITFLTFQGVDHMASLRKFFYIRAARDWLMEQCRED